MKRDIDTKGFCKETACVYFYRNECTYGGVGCVFSARAFMKWLIQNGYKIVKDGE